MGLLLFSLFGCREFYDEEFEEFEQNRPQDDNENLSYSAALDSTDPNLTSLRGDVRMSITGENVDIRIDIDGLPQNVTGAHYSFLNSDCSSQNFVIPHDPAQSTRTLNISESITTTALRADLQTGGVPTDIRNLEGKSLIVRAFANFSDIPNPQNTNSIVIVCGTLERDDGGGTTGGFAGGVSGGVAGGTIDGSLGGGGGGEVGGEVGGGF